MNSSAAPLTCAQFRTVWAQMLAEFQSDDNNHSEPAADVVQRTQDVINHVILPCICVFGILGNVLNIIVLTQKQLKSTMDRLEKSAHAGLVALATADLLFCIAILPAAFMERKTMYYSDEWRFWLYYRTYKVPLCNVLLFASTWLTVTMATSRYLAICHPLRARWFISLKWSKIAIVSVYLLAACVNLPYFWSLHIYSERCGQPILQVDCTCYSIKEGTTFTGAFKDAVNIVCGVLGVFIPLVLLAFCNTCLIRALRRSARMRSQYVASSTHAQSDSGHRITPTLIAIVILFFVLVVPSELIKFSENLIIDRGRFQHLVLAVAITNVMQVINFAINFVLYVVINAHFRKTVRRIICCVCIASRRRGYETTNGTAATMTYDMTEMGTKV